MPKSSIPLKIVGTVLLLEDLQNQVKAANLQDCIELLGWQEKSTVLHLMQSAQFLVFPSIWYEPFGLSVIEAFACSLPVIVSRLGSLAEIVENQVTGLHFEAGDATDLVLEAGMGCCTSSSFTRNGTAGESGVCGLLYSRREL
uniref:Glycosyltransferase n=1 Tax=Desertifilum tharense IPPAS B-1220 TaxID=1781255 RepID=A0ACD5GZN4_9CYAN